MRASCAWMYHNGASVSEKQVFFGRLMVIALDLHIITVASSQARKFCLLSLHTLKPLSTIKEAIHERIHGSKEIHRKQLRERIGSEEQFGIQIPRKIHLRQWDTNKIGRMLILKLKNDTRNIWNAVTEPSVRPSVSVLGVATECDKSIHQHQMFLLIDWFDHRFSCVLRCEDIMTRLK